jgi:hypothetical protein
MALDHLRLGDLSDREILLTLMDVADHDGYADARDIAMQLAMIGDHPHRAVASRLSWLRRYGAVDREEEPHKPEDGGPPVRRWRLTQIGEAIATGSLKRAQERALEEVGDDQLVLLTRLIAERARASGSATSAKLAEREWKHRWIRVNGYPRGY